jgi:hypothetical protein
MFHFPRLPAYSYEFTVCSKLFKLSGFPIRISPDQSPLAAPRGFSQPATSFVDAYRLGIHHVLFSTSNQNFAFRSCEPLLAYSTYKVLVNWNLGYLQRDCIHFFYLLQLSKTVSPWGISIPPGRREIW